MEHLFNKIFSFLNSVQSKIAFYPTVLAALGFNFAFFMMYLEDRGISKYLLETIPVLVVDNGNTALTLLSSFITGLISMMVFSFSMVMVLLNQASSNYSPRLLPGLISDKNHQIILGIYLFTILYCIFILFSIQPTGDKYQIPGFSVLLGILFTVICICAFIYFIHNISQNIQINNILDKIFKLSEKRLKYLIEAEDGELEEFPDTSGWHEYHTEKTGYFQNVALKNIRHICERENTQVYILPVKGIFVLQGIPVFKSRKELDKETIDEILDNFNFARGELVADNYALAFKQITEIIVKAMSPGINDPGTALNGIDYLTELFALRMLKRDESMISKDKKVYIKLSTINFERLMYNVLASIRSYCKHDVILVQKLTIMFMYLKSQKASHSCYYDVIDKEAAALLADAQNAISNERDCEVIMSLAKKLGLKTDTFEKE
ncbi:DUF2254 domain-containing protein [Zunongwangia sp. F363]|uniref:DUF2254 domain-containing protein n=1 Tax=Autumnicola tepida TaxID=3075595 RepID=A0ABU3C9D8_9FLAO|nr:DUF2254 domain-containing protein [Zunongwangia sp. F363]MDT0642929.1 DUF2254 domain-containing protein [Zunongwangia sp. F363]